MTAFLGVEKSLSDRRWTGPDAARDRSAQALMQATGLPDPLCRVLARLGVESNAVKDYLAPSLRALMPDPSTLRDMDRAAERVLEAIDNNQKIAIFADYDVDGAASAALMKTWLEELGSSPTLYVPDRLTEGYGPNEAAMRGLARTHDLIITVDCGTVANDAIGAAKGADVIVLDHHLGGEILPPALAVVNPNRQDEDNDFGGLCAAGVVFLLLVAVNRLLRLNGRSGPDLLAMLDLVALATVADVAPLTGLNRAYVQQGLSVMAQRKRIGLTALCDVARLDGPPNAYHLGFLLGPRLNAGGRIGKSDLGARLLSCRDSDEAAALATRLDALNSRRREVEEQVRLQAIAQASERGLDAPLVWAAGDGWHPGVVGIVAARLKETANRPALVIGFDGDTGHGSARSIGGVDLGAAISRLAGEGLITRGGGHKMAAGLSLERPQLVKAMERLGELLARQGADKAGGTNLHLDGLIAPAAASADLVEDLERAGPFGAGAAGPRWALSPVRVVFAKRAGENHLRLTFAGDDGTRIDAIAFRAFDSPIGAALSDHAGRLFHVAGRLEIDTWGGRRKVKLRLEDASALTL